MTDEPSVNPYFIKSWRHFSHSLAPWFWASSWVRPSGGATATVPEDLCAHVVRDTKDPRQDFSSASSPFSVSWVPRSSSVFVSWVGEMVEGVLVQRRGRGNYDGCGWQLLWCCCSRSGSPVPLIKDIRAGKQCQSQHSPAHKSRYSVAAKGRRHPVFPPLSPRFASPPSFPRFSHRLSTLPLT